MKFSTLLEQYTLTEKVGSVDDLYKALKKMGWKKADDVDLAYTMKDGTVCEITYDDGKDTLTITATATKGSGGATKDSFEDLDTNNPEEALKWIKARQ